MSKSNGYTPIERAILTILSDGKGHPADELHKCCGPSSRSALRKHISCIRKKLKPRGENIVFVNTGKGLRYQLVRLLHSPYDGLS